MANTNHDQLAGSDLHVNKEYPATGTPLRDWTQTDARYTQQTRAIATTGPLIGGGNLSGDRTLSIPAATTTNDGYLKATDWQTFNAKQARNVITVGSSGTMGNDYTCTGNADNTVIQAAINAVDAAGGGTVFLRAGIYNLRNAVNLSGKNRVRLQGDQRATIFQILQADFTGNNWGYSYMVGGDAAGADITVDGIYFKGNYSAYAGLPTNCGTRSGGGWHNGSHRSSWEQ